MAAKAVAVAVAVSVAVATEWMLLWKVEVGDSQDVGRDPAPLSGALCRSAFGKLMQTAGNLI